MMEDCIGEAKLEYEDGKKDPEIRKPDKFSQSKWVSWEAIGYNYFTNIKNSRVSPLAYVIRKTPDRSGIVIEREQEIIQDAPLQRNMFTHDTKKVLAITK